MTTVPCWPRTSSSVTQFPVRGSSNSNSGAFVPKGIIADGVAAIKFSDPCSIDVVVLCMTQQEDERIRKLFERRRFGIHPGLANTRALLRAVGDPHLQVKAIHVAGTNGKGGLCHVLYSTLLQQGVSVGLFTSPHIVDFRERFRVDGRMISPEELDNILDQVLPPAEEIGCTFFEISTVIAFVFFAQQNVSHSILETGMGGRLDSTNVCVPVVTAITGIGLDHTDFLGDTLAKVAAEKAGIMKSKVPVVIGQLPAEAADVIAEHARELDVEVLTREQSGYSFCAVKRELSGSTQYEATAYGDAQTAVLPLPGSHWPHLLTMTCDIVEKLHVCSSEESVVASVLAGAQRCIADGYMGRMQLMYKEPLVMLDIAHNEQSLVNLVETIAQCGWDVPNTQCVFGVMADKDLANVLPQLSQFHTVFSCAPPLDRALDSDILVGKFPAGKAINAQTVSNAIKLAMQSGRKTVICGSFFVAEQAFHFFHKHYPGKNHDHS